MMLPLILCIQIRCIRKYSHCYTIRATRNIQCIREVITTVNEFSKGHDAEMEQHPIHVLAEEFKGLTIGQD